MFSEKHGVHLTESSCSMLVGDVCRWVLIFVVFLMAFALGSYVALIMSTRTITGKCHFSPDNIGREIRRAQVAVPLLSAPTHAVRRAPYVSAIESRERNAACRTTAHTPYSRCFGVDGCS